MKKFISEAMLLIKVGVIYMEQVLAATQTPGESGSKWAQGTADAVRRFIWVFEVGILYATYIYAKIVGLVTIK